MDIYYNPEKFGLELVGEVDFGDMYNFDIFAVWMEKATGRLGYAQDSGCSCNSPFEYYGIDEITWDSPHEIARKLKKVAGMKKRWRGHSIDGAVVNLITKLMFEK